MLQKFLNTKDNSIFCSIYIKGLSMKGVCRYFSTGYWLLFISLFFTGCISSEDSSSVEIVAHPKFARIQTTNKENLRKLLKVVKGDDQKRKAVEDVITILRAEIYEENYELDRAAREWTKAIKIGKGEYGKIALEGWIRVYKGILKDKCNSEVLTRLLLGETKNGSESIYLVDKRYTSFDKLNKFIIRYFPDEEGSLKESGKKDYKIPTRGIPKDDPLLRDASEYYCKTKDLKNFDKKIWHRWLSTLSKHFFTYFEAKTNICLGHYQKAETILRKTLPVLLKKKDSSLVAIEASQMLVEIYRRIGEREKASNAYITLMKAFRNPAVKGEEYGDSDTDLIFWHINSALWAARYRAMTGDYLNARGYVHEAFELIEQVYSDYPKLKKKVKDQLVEYKAEGYHILAFRIAFEQKDYFGALELMKLGIRIADLDEQWQKRFHWYIGFYEYLRGDYFKAHESWKVLISDSKDDRSSQPRILFWLALSNYKMNREKESNHYLKILLDRYPLSYYAVVAPELVNIDGHKEWQANFESTKDMEEAITSYSDYELSLFRDHSEVGPLLLRAEILATADIGELSTLAVRLLYWKARRTFVLRSNIKPFLFLSKLLHQVSEYWLAISLTTDLANSNKDFWDDYPEQILVYYPRPFTDIYERHASKMYMDKESFLAVSRQESSFNANAKSPAGAIGVMQLMETTGKRFADKIDLKDNQNFSERLLNPEVNIRIASHYLRFLFRYYKNSLPPVFGAYNAGEYAVDRWVKKRDQKELVAWIEAIPFSETRNYVQLVWRNVYVYKFLGRKLNSH